MEENCKVPDKPKSFRKLMGSSYFWKPASGLIIGGLLGFLYYYFDDSASAGSGITGNPLSSVIFGGALGWFFVNRPCGRC